MQVRSAVRFFREASACEVALEVSGQVEATPDEYTVTLAPGLGLESAAEVEAAEQALIAEFRRYDNVADCDGCGEETEVREVLDFDPIYGKPYCVAYACSRCTDDDASANASERAHESELSAYYGGSGPRTDAEVMADARRLK